MFGGHRHSGIGENIALVCQMILQEHVIKGTCNFMGRNPFKSVKMLPNFMAMGTVVEKI